MQKHCGVEQGVGGIGLLILLAIILPLATTELATLFAAERVRPYRLIAAVGSGALMLHAFLTQFPPFQAVAASTLAFIIVFIPLLAALRRAWVKQTQEAITTMAGTVLSTLYLGGLGWFLMALRVKHSPPGRRHDFHGTTAIILVILLMVKFTDIGAYFGGKALGRRKLIPWLSPGKTWEGLAFGLLTAGLVGMAFTPAIEHAEVWRPQPRPRLRPQLRLRRADRRHRAVGRLAGKPDETRRRSERQRQADPRLRRHPRRHRQPPAGRAVRVSAVQLLLIVIRELAKRKSVPIIPRAG